MELSGLCMSALKVLAKTKNGVPFDDLGIDNKDFMYLVDAGLVEEPSGKIAVLGGDRMIVHDGVIMLTGKGRALLAQKRKDRSAKRSEWIRWAITAAIALAAFIKSFFF